MYDDIVDGRQRRIEMPLCDYSDPLDQPDDELFERYHFRMESILFLLQTLAIQVRPTNRSNPVPLRSMPFFLRCGFTLLDLSTTLSATL